MYNVHWILILFGFCVFIVLRPLREYLKLHAENRDARERAEYERDERAMNEYWRMYGTRPQERGLINIPPAPAEQHKPQPRRLDFSDEL